MRCSAEFSKPTIYKLALCSGCNFKFVFITYCVEYGNFALILGEQFPRAGSFHRFLGNSSEWLSKVFAWKSLLTGVSGEISVPNHISRLNQ